MCNGTLTQHNDMKRNRKIYLFVITVTLSLEKLNKTVHFRKLGDKLEPPQIDEDNDVSDEKAENTLETQVSEGAIQGNEQPNAKNSSSEEDNPAIVIADEEPSVASEDGVSRSGLIVETGSSEIEHSEASVEIPAIGM